MNRAAREMIKPNRPCYIRVPIVNGFQIVKISKKTLLDIIDESGAQYDLRVRDVWFEGDEEETTITEIIITG